MTSSACACRRCASACSRLAGESVTGPCSTDRRLQALAQRRQAQAEEVILGDPFVQEVMRDFGGRIVPGTLKATPA